MKIIVGTKNPTKVAVVEAVFQQVLGSALIIVVAHDAKSNVPEAPHDRETYEGALQRAQECSTIVGCDFYVGIESGLAKRYGNLFEEAWAVVITKEGKRLLGYSSGLMLPNVVRKRMTSGEKHNEIMASLDKQFNLPDDNRDTWSRYTGGNISRQVSLEEALRNALIQATHSDRNLYLL